MILRIQKRYIGNGTSEAVRLEKFKLKSLKSNFGSGQTWHIVFEGGKELNTLHKSRGRDSWRKNQLEVVYQE